MHIIIAETGEPPNNLSATHGGYAEMFVAMLSRAGLAFTHETIPVFRDGSPRVPPPNASSALLITGSPAGVYELHPWIAPLEADVRAYLEAGSKVVGICFGHQLMAQALGGRVEKSSKGWGVGVHTYERNAGSEPVIDAAMFSCAVSHQDQVLAVPPGATCLAGSAFCPNGVIAYANGRGLSFQMHPEFEPAFGKSLINARRDRIPGETAEEGLRSYDDASSREQIAQWICNFLLGE